METEMFNTLVGPLLFAMCAGVYGFVQRPEQRNVLLHALVLLFAGCAVVFRFFPSAALFQLMVLDGLVVTALYALFVRQHLSPNFNKR